MRQIILYAQCQGELECVKCYSLCIVVYNNGSKSV